MKKIRFALIIVAAFAAFHFIPIFNRPEAAVTRFLLGAAGALRGEVQNVLSFGRGVSSPGQLVSENQNLKDQLSSDAAQLADLSEVKAENESLRSLLEFGKRGDVVTVGANVVGTDPSVSADALIIDRGSESGIGRGDAVVYGNGIMIGKIEAVAPGRATVLLTIDPKCAIDALVAGRPEAAGVANGDRGLVIKLSLIPQNAVFSSGDEVITSGGEDLIPRGLLIGEVDSVSKSPAEPFSSATVIPSYDQNSLTAVAVVRKK